MWDARQETASVEEVIREIEFGRGQSQLFDLGLGGQQERKYLSPDELEVDTLDFLRALKPYEVQLKPYFRTDEEYYHNVWFDIEEYVERIFVGAKSSGGDNTFNYSCRMSNHLNFYFFKFPEVEERFVFAAKMHLHGDVRGCYSPYMIFSLSWDEYFDAIYEARRKVYFEVEGREGMGTITVSPMEEEFEVEYVDDDWNLDIHMSAYTVSEVVERVEEELEELHRRG